MVSLGFIELILIFGIALGIGAWQLWSVNRAIAEDKANADDSTTDQGTRGIR